jgi:hypothetical protein
MAAHITDWGEGVALNSSTRKRGSIVGESLFVLELIVFYKDVGDAVFELPHQSITRIRI